MSSAPAPTDPAQYTAGWEKKWVDNNIHWDQGKSHGALVRFLDDAEATAKAGIPKDGCAFVPGCGQVSNPPLGRPGAQGRRQQAVPTRSNEVHG